MSQQHRELTLQVIRSSTDPKRNRPVWAHGL
jgi:hypothetical protein